LRSEENWKYFDKAYIFTISLFRTLSKVLYAQTAMYYIYKYKLHC